MSLGQCVFDGDVAVLYADNPLITVPTIRKLMARRASGARGGNAEAGLALLAMRPADPGRYGRLVTEPSGDVARIVECRDEHDRQVDVPVEQLGLHFEPGHALHADVEHTRALLHHRVVDRLARDGLEGGLAGAQEAGVGGALVPGGARGGRSGS